MNAATRNRARVLLGIIAVLLFASGATALYFRFRNPVGGASPYRTVNGHHFITFAPEQAAYPADTRIFRLTISNRAGEDLIPEEDRRDEWVLEVKQGGVWHTLRADGHGVCWDFDPEEYGQEAYGAGVRPSGAVERGRSLTYLCPVWAYYALPLEPGSYRIVFPGMRLSSTRDLAAEFEVY